MADTLHFMPLVTRPNGLNAPLYADGQVIHAADLTLDRSAHDAELWRLRRLLHGWGVVAGLVAEVEANALYLNRGYGLCPSGKEVLLPEDLVIADLPGLMAAACGPAAPGCDLAATPAAAGGPLTVWLVIRPFATAGAPRAALPQDCSHPGNALAPSRLCGGVTLGLCCSLPEGHAAIPPDCASLKQALCSGEPLFMPEDHPNPDLLVLARLSLGDGVVEIDTSLRRPLYPLSVLQDFIIACGCAKTPPPAEGDATHVPPVPAEDDATHVPPVPAEDDTTHVPPVTTPPDQPDHGQPDRGQRIDWASLLDKARKKEKILVEHNIIPDPAGPVIAPDDMERLASSGLSPTEILTGPTAELATRTGLSTNKIDQLKSGLARVRGRIGGIGF